MTFTPAKSRTSSRPDDEIQPLLERIHWSKSFLFEFKSGPSLLAFVDSDFSAYGKALVP